MTEVVAEGYRAQRQAGGMISLSSGTLSTTKPHRHPGLGLWEPSLTAAWSASAALFAAYAPSAGAAPAPSATLPDGPHAVAEVLDRAVNHGDEHVIKFTDTAAEVYSRTGQAEFLAAALRVGRLIASPRA